MLVDERASPSLWEDQAPGAAFAPLAAERFVDVAIVGAGISGLTAALRLARAGKRVLVLEAADHIGAGTSGGTSAHLTSILDTRYKTLIERTNAAHSRLVAAAARTALDLIEENVNQAEIACNFARVPGYLYTEWAEDVQSLRDELSALGTVGIPANWIDHAPLPFANQGGIAVPDQAIFQPLRYLNGLAQAVIAAGGEIATGTRVLSVTGGEPCKIECEAGLVQAQAVFIATHIPINDAVLFTQNEPYQSYVIAARLPEGTPYPDGVFWDTEDPYFYTRTAMDSDGPLLVVGGADHKTGHEEDTEQRLDAVVDYVRQRYGPVTVTHRWSAQFYEPADGLPFIGAYPKQENVYAATGYSGNGLTWGTIAGQIISDHLLEQPNPFAELFPLLRLRPLAAAGTVIKAGLDTALRFVGDRLRGAGTTLEEIEPGQGALIRHEGEQLAVYRDEAGALHALAPQCTHLGCVVQWNTAEKTWDCPCHGGRFACTGSPVAGPPTEGLEPREL